MTAGNPILLKVGVAFLIGSAVLIGLACLFQELRIVEQFYKHDAAGRFDIAAHPRPATAEAESVSRMSVGRRVFARLFGQVSKVQLGVLFGVPTAVILVVLLSMLCYYSLKSAGLLPSLDNTRSIEDPLVSPDDDDDDDADDEDSTVDDTSLSSVVNPVVYFAPLILGLSVAVGLGLTMCIGLYIRRSLVPSTGTASSVGSVGSVGDTAPNGTPIFVSNDTSIIPQPALSPADQFESNIELMNEEAAVALARICAETQAIAAAVDKMEAKSAAARVKAKSKDNAKTADDEVFYLGPFNDGYPSKQELVSTLIDLQPSIPARKFREDLHIDETNCNQDDLVNHYATYNLYAIFTEEGMKTLTAEELFSCKCRDLDSAVKLRKEIIREHRKTVIDDIRYHRDASCKICTVPREQIAAASQPEWARLRERYYYSGTIAVPHQMHGGGQWIFGDSFCGWPVVTLDDNFLDFQRTHIDASEHHFMTASTLDKLSKTVEQIYKDFSKIEILPSGHNSYY